jgi:hypothetical protein
LDYSAKRLLSLPFQTALSSFLLDVFGIAEINKNETALDSSYPRKWCFVYRFGKCFTSQTLSFLSGKTGNVQGWCGISGFQLELPGGR